MKIEKKMNFFLVTMMLLVTNCALLNAQVTIGSNKAPEKFSLLELISENGNSGLRLPQIESTAKRDAIFTNAAGFKNNPLAFGLQIYNMETRCVEYWDAIRWVSLCLGTANITLEGDPCNYDPLAIAPADGIQPECIFTPKDDPDCVVPNGQAYQVYLTGGATYAYLEVDEMTSAFSLTFYPNDCAHSRVAVVRVVNNCSGEYKDFIFTQDGATCPNDADPFNLQTNTDVICGDNGAVIAYISNPQEGINYMWEYHGMIVHTGNYLEIKRAGKYTVYAGAHGCTTPTPQSVNITKNNESAPGRPVVKASNNGILCMNGNVILTASNVSSTVKWFHNGNLYNSTQNPLTVSGAWATGEWFAVQQDGNCSSPMSNIVVLTDKTSNNTALDAPVVTVNGTLLTNNPVICKGGTLELEVINSYPPIATFELFEDGISVIRNADRIVYYTIPPHKTSVVLSVQVNSSLGGCPNTAISNPINITFTAPPPTTINNGANKASICGSGKATLVANNSSGVEYQWFLNGTTVSGATAATYQTNVPGTYTVRYKDANGCWSMISTSIIVEANAAVELRWIGGTPSATEVFPNDKTYSVNAIPAVNQFIWSSSDTSVAEITPIGNGQSASINYKIAGNVIITVSSVDNGCGVSTLTLPVTVTAGCSPINSLTLIPSGSPQINKYVNSDGNYQSISDGYTDFSVTTNGGGAATSYQWYVNNVLEQNATSSTFKYITPNTGTQNVDIKVTVKNGCTPDNNDAGISAQATVHVVKFAQEDVSGSYRISGKNCFDLAKSNDGGACAPLSSRSGDFETPNPTYSYTFAPTTTSSYSNLSFIISDPNGLIASYTPSIASGTSPSYLTVVFDRAAVMAKALGTTKITALSVTIIAIYQDNTGANKQMSYALSIQDCTCGCTVKKAGGGYITFMCYNLGVDEATKSMSPLEQAATSSPSGNYVNNSKVYGDLYQWGRKADGHEKRNSPVHNATGSVSFGLAYDANDQVAPISPAYGKFIIVSTNGIGDWHGNHNSYKNDNLWNFNIYPANNPCPPGWRVPTQEEWSSIMQGGAVGTTAAVVNNIPSAGQLLNSGNFWKWNPATNGTAGWLISPDGGTNYTLFLPANGNREYSNGALYNAGAIGTYWASLTSTVAQMTPTNLTPATGGALRANGFAVRCVAE